MQLDQIGPTDAMRRAFNIQRGAKPIAKPTPAERPSIESFRKVAREHLRNTKGERVFHGGREYLVLRGVTFTCITKGHPEPPSGFNVFKYRQIPLPKFAALGLKPFDCLPVAIKNGTVNHLRILFEVWEASDDYVYVLVKPNGDELRLT